VHEKTELFRRASSKPIQLTPGPELSFPSAVGMAGSCLSSARSSAPNPHGTTRSLAICAYLGNFS
jgi:hypothetical protein